MLYSPHLMAKRSHETESLCPSLPSALSFSLSLSPRLKLSTLNICFDILLKEVNGVATSSGPFSSLESMITRFEFYRAETSSLAKFSNNNISV